MLTPGPYGCRRRSLSYLVADLILLVGPEEDGSFHWAYSSISPHLSFGIIASKSSAFFYAYAMAVFLRIPSFKDESPLPT